MVSVYIKATGKFYKAFTSKADANFWIKSQALYSPVAYEIRDGVPNEYIADFAKREKEKRTKTKLVSIDDA